MSSRDNEYTVPVKIPEPCVEHGLPVVWPVGPVTVRTLWPRARIELGLSQESQPLTEPSFARKTEPKQGAF